MNKPKKNKMSIRKRIRAYINGLNSRGNKYNKPRKKILIGLVIIEKSYLEIKTIAKNRHISIVKAIRESMLKNKDELVNQLIPTIDQLDLYYDDMTIGKLMENQLRDIRLAYAIIDSDGKLIKTYYEKENK